MTNAFQNIEKLEADLWTAADNLRANANLPSSDYFLPVLGVIFLRHAANRFADRIEARVADQGRSDCDFAEARPRSPKTQASGKMPRRKVQPEGYLRRRALFLPEPARHDWIMEQAATRNAGMAISPGAKGAGKGSSRKVSRQIKLGRHVQGASPRIV